MGDLPWAMEKINELEAQHDDDQQRIAELQQQLEDSQDRCHDLELQVVEVSRKLAAVDGKDK